MTVAVGSAEPGAENELRLRRRLWGDPIALRAVRGLGFKDASIRHFRLGLNEPQLASDGRMIERALAFPVLRADGTRAGRWSYLNLEDVTEAPQHPVGWTPGGVRTCWSRPVTEGSILLLVPSLLDMMLVWQALGDSFGSLVIACPSIPGAIPREWRDTRFWRGWSEVVLGMSDRSDEDAAARTVAQTLGDGLRRCAPAGGETWADIVRLGGSAAEVRRLIDGAKVWVPVLPPITISGQSIVGDFSADPVSVEGAFIGGRLHYAVTMERRELESTDTGGSLVVQRYVTRILRSDGVLLDVERLPAPAGTPVAGRVLALSDGTRIISAPQPGHFGTWSFTSIQRFIAVRGRGDEPEHRPLPRLVADVEAHLRSSVWLPHDEDYALAALFVVGTFVHRAFEAYPILLVNGPKASGKSELGQALASVSCNAVVAGRITPAGLIRLLAESRGAVVLDDLEAIATPRNGNEDVSQILKVSYKASTSLRVSPGRDGRIEVLDFFAPKIVTNIGGADPVLLSRMLPIRTSPMTADAEVGDYGVDSSELRDELHVWAMCQVASVRSAYAPLAVASRSRRDEISAPMRALAGLCGGELPERLERALAAEAPEAAEPVDTILARALHRLICEEGVTDIAMPRLALEFATCASGPVEIPSAETLGRMLLAIRARERDGVVERRRLHGEVTRIYRLSSGYVEKLGRPSLHSPDPFAFCGASCSACRYDDVCDRSVPWLRPARLARTSHPN